MEYLTNVFMAGSSMFLAGLVLFFASLLALWLLPVKDEELTALYYKLSTLSRYLGLVLMAIALLVGLMSPANTYKNQPFDVQESHQKIERINAEKRSNAPTAVQDLTKQRISTEERKAAFDAMVDYKKQ